jgi:hypothetical protein
MTRRGIWVLLAVGCLVVAAGIFAVGVRSTPTAAGAARVAQVTEEDWEGYDGNATIYPTEYTGVTYPAQLSGNAFQERNCITEGGVISFMNNTVDVNTSHGDAASGNGTYYTYATGHFTEYIMTTVGGTGNIVPSYSPTVLAGYPGAILTQFATSGLGVKAASAITVVVQNANQSGRNVSLGSAMDPPAGFVVPGWVPLVADTVLASAALAAPEFAIPITLAGVGTEWFGWAGGFSGTANGGVVDTTNLTSAGDGWIDYWSEVTDGVPPTGSTDGFNGFSQSVQIGVTIPAPTLAQIKGGTETITGANQIWGADGAVCGGANTSAEYRVAPAVSLQGQVLEYPHGPGTAGAMVELQQTCGTTTRDFDEPTGPGGDWQFFADPGCFYLYSATAANPFPGDTLESSTVNISSYTVAANKGQAEVVTSPLTLGYWGNISESGLPAKTTWSATLGGVGSSSSGSTIAFLESNGSWPYTIGGVAGYSVSSSSGSISITGADHSISVSFTPTSGGKYSITFDESGLEPAGKDWTVSLESDSKSSTGTSISFSVNNGNYGFTLPNLSVGDDLAWVPSPNHGTITVNNESVTKDITYTEQATNPCGRPAQCFAPPRGQTPGPVASISPRSGAPVSGGGSLLMRPRWGSDP